MKIKKYDADIKAAINLCMPGIDWRLYKAQLCQESALNPLAQSPAGAQGIAQFMPGTWRDVSAALEFPQTATAFDPDYAIIAGAYYMSEIKQKWTSEREESDRYMLSLASYNAGFGSLLKAQKNAHWAVEYYPIISKLNLVTGHAHSNETIKYVENIFKIFGEYLMKGR